jgi:exodeoxyribonuclease-3
MKIASFNVNKRLANLPVWLRAAEPDVVRLQEIKAADRESRRPAMARSGAASFRHRVVPQKSGFCAFGTSDSWLL